MPETYIKKNRATTKFKKYSWTIVPVIAIGGLFYPKLGLLLIPIMLTLMILGFLKGKYWCGNLCPHASLFDYVLLPISPNKEMRLPLKSLSLKAAFFMLYMSMFTLRIIKVSKLWGTLEFVDKLGFLFSVNYLIPTIVGITLTLFVNPRAWCTFCPMGTMQQLTYRLGKHTGWNKHTDVLVTCIAPDKCTKCKICAKVCPMQLSPYLELSDRDLLDNEDCIKCSTCVTHCPGRVLVLGDSKVQHICEDCILP
jgi:polyferredoxin